MPVSFILPVVSQTDNYKKLCLCRVEIPHIFCILLARDLRAIFTVGGLGGKDQQSGL